MVSGYDAICRKDERADNGTIIHGRVFVYFCIGETSEFLQNNNDEVTVTKCRRMVSFYFFSKSLTKSQKRGCKIYEKDS